MRVLAAAVALLLAGCAATPPTATWRYPVPVERIYAKDWHLPEGSAPAADRVRVALVRDVNLAGGACTWRFRFNDLHVVTVANGEGVTLQVPPGTYEVELAIGLSICPPYSTTRRIQVEAGKPLLLWAENPDWSPTFRALPIP